ncbi:MAG: hypothetical protein HOH36_07900 [Acidimicrobiaceae bacterium]|nr:hypothetical protein [Acidimicrobiaceae bacterium]MBT5580497.1 hypothetical protein [Acidimicrobiaceae bacterium]MBT5850339.1 hypothetical protein [Acidimicrobiaceae bacterium]
MAYQLRRPTATASVTSTFARLRMLTRRIPIWRAVAALVAAVLVAQTVTSASRAMTDAEAAWGSGRDVWVATGVIEAGTRVASRDVVRQPAPTALLPVDAVIDDPTGERTRVSLTKGEILRSADLGMTGAGPVAAAVDEGRHAVTISVSADIYAVGDLVGMVAILDGHILVDDGIAVSTQPGSVTVSVDDTAISRVVEELGRGGIEVTLVGR